MTHDDWRRAEPILTEALLLPLFEQKRLLESAFLDEVIRGELLDVLRRTSVRIPRGVLSGTAAQSGSVGAGGGTLLVEPLPPVFSANDRVGDGRFHIIRQLGRGGMGEVYLASDTRLETLVALKVLLGGRTREAQHARRCSGHPHIATMHDVIETTVGERALTVLVMEHVAGRPLSRIIDDGPVSILDGVRWTRQVASALAHAHDCGVLHCDLKPANVLVGADGAKVVDFGIGRATFEAATPAPIAGTLPYMAPEQLTDHHFSVPGDIYSLGVTLFEVVAGRPPFEGNETELILRVVGAPVPSVTEFRSGIPGELEDIITCALAKHPAQRYRSARAFERALAQFEDSLTKSVAPLPSAPPPTPSLSWTRLAVLVLSLVAALAVLGFVSSTTLDAGLGRTGRFRVESPWWWPVWGAMSLTAPLVLVGLGALLLMMLLPLWQVVSCAPGRIGRGVCAVADKCRTLDTSLVAQVLLAVNVAAVAAFAWYFSPILTAVASFTTGGPTEDLLPLSPRNSAAHDTYRMSVTLLLAVSGLAWYRFLRRVRSQRDSGVPPAAIGGAVVFALTLLLSVMPHRMLYHNEAERALYGGRHCSFIARDGDEGLLFCLFETTRLRRVAMGDPNLVRTGQIDNIFRPFETDVP